MNRVQLPKTSVFFIMMILLTITGPVLVGSSSMKKLNVASIIDRYVEAIGGSALKGINSESRRGTLLRGTQGQVPFEMKMKTPGKWLYNQTFAFGDQVTYGHDGKTGWIQDTKGISPMNEVEELDLLLIMDIQAPLKLRQLFTEMNVSTVDRKNERDLVTITAKSAKGIPFDLVFDRKTGLLVRAGEIYFEDYKKVDAINIPHTIIIRKNQDAFPLKMQFIEIIQNPDLEDASFQQPRCALPFKKAPLYTIRREIPVNPRILDTLVGIYQHPTKPEISYQVSRQQDHLMIKRTDWPYRIEIKPESENDYFVRFLNWEFHFVRDASGQVIRFEIGPDRSIAAKKIK